MGSAEAVGQAVSRHGYRMEPLLLCPVYSCAWAEYVRKGVDVPGLGYDLRCPNCGDRLMLVSYATVEPDASSDDLTEYGLRKAKGTWYR